MLNFFAGYAAIAVVMLGLDLLWLGLIAKRFYRDGIGHLMADSPNLVAAGIFYLLYPVGIMVFAVAPALVFGEAAVPAEVTLARAVLAGALFGFFAYATYELTNLALLKDWPLRVTLVDIAWGTALTAVCAAAGHWAMGAIR